MDELWSITEEELTDLLSEAFEEGWSGYKENQESTIKRIVRRFRRQQEKSQDKAFVEALKKESWNKKKNCAFDLRDAPLEWQVSNPGNTFTTTISNPETIYSFNDINSTLSGLDQSMIIEVEEDINDEEDS